MEKIDLGYLDLRPSVRMCLVTSDTLKWSSLRQKGKSRTANCSFEIPNSALKKIAVWPSKLVVHGSNHLQPCFQTKALMKATE